jgi:hypothetical protein
MENNTETPPQPPKARNLNPKHRVWVRLQRSNPDGSPTRLKADDDFELNLSPDVSADFAYALRDLIKSTRKRQAATDQENKRFKSWRRRFPLLAEKMGDDTMLQVWWSHHIDRPAEERKARRLAARQTPPRAPDVFPTPRFPGRR